MINIDDRLIKEVSPKIRPNALSVLLAIAIHLNQKSNRAFPSHHRLMTLTGLGRDAVYVALETLKKNGLLQSSQALDHKTKKFGKRVFRISTKFISIFVAAQDAEPLPEFPYTGEPYTDEPYTGNQETEHINKEEQINEFEHTLPGADGESKTANAQSPVDSGALPNLGYSFEMFWNDYAHKVGSKAKCEKIFGKLPERDREAIRATIEMYKRDTVTTDAGRAGATFKPLRQNPQTYLNGRVWETYADRQQEIQGTEQPTEFDEAYQKYVRWIENNYPACRHSSTYFTKAHFIELKRNSKAAIIGRESEQKFLKTAHERASIENADAWTIFQNLINERLKSRQV